MKKVLFNVSFKDKHTGKMNLAGKTTTMTEERIAEINAVDSSLITVVCEVKSDEDKGDK